MGMKRWRWLLILVAILGFFLFELSIYSIEENLLQKGSERGIAFLSGGFGEREREILSEKAKEYSLKLIFSDRKGEYIFDVMVKVFNQRDEKVLITASSGPWIFINLPTGVYHLEACYQKVLKRVGKIKIEKRIQKMISIQW